ncbi:PRC-barrel domain-containing protein [Micromonospora luteifusca]|uniref:PRC-barrel domain-containing protein n=1 Tax=Micromonospora luteifusca TaxID=709860 RepID=UPI0033AEACAA
MEDLGAKISYLALPVGTRVYDVDSAPVGVVEHVLTDEPKDIFHGIIVAPPGPDQSHRFAQREQIADLYERGSCCRYPVPRCTSRARIRRPEWSRKRLTTRCSGPAPRAPASISAL